MGIVSLDGRMEGFIKVSGRMRIFKNKNSKRFFQFIKNKLL